MPATPPNRRPPAPLPERFTELPARGLDHDPGHDTQKRGPALHGADLRLVPAGRLAGAAEARPWRLGNTLRRCASGIELIERGLAADVDLASQLNCSTAVPWLREGAFVNRVTA